MARTFTVSELVTSIRRRADVEKTQFVTDAEIIEYIDRSNAELYDLLVSTYNDYFVTLSSNYTLSGSEYITPLPADFYKLLGVDSSQSGLDNWLTLRPVNFNERNSRNSVLYNLAYHPTHRYHLQNDQIRLIGNPGLVGVARIWYVPAPTKYTTGNQTIDGRAGWEEFIIVDCCRKIKIKQELDAMPYEAEKERLKARILSMARNYDAGMPRSVTDVMSVNEELLFPFATP